ncbi:MAG: hypothetical protein ABIP08_03910 [Lautropia sp.]
MGNDSRFPDDTSERQSLDHLYVETTGAEDPRFNTRNGVFYPTGFILLALSGEQAVSRAVALLTGGGIVEKEITLLRPEQMRKLTDKSRHDAGLLSQIIGAELKQMTVLSQLADDDHHFLLVKDGDECRRVIETIGLEPGVSRGLMFHTLAVEELPVVKEKIPGKSPFGVNEVIRNHASDAEMRGNDKS